MGLEKYDCIKMLLQHCLCLYVCIQITKICTCGRLPGRKRAMFYCVFKLHYCMNFIKGKAYTCFRSSTIQGSNSIIDTKPYPVVNIWLLTAFESIVTRFLALSLTPVEPPLKSNQGAQKRYCCASMFPSSFFGFFPLPTETTREIGNFFPAFL